MKATKKQILKEIVKLQKQHDVFMEQYYRTQTNESYWGDGDIYKKADTIANNKQLLINALALIEKYETTL